VQTAEHAFAAADTTTSARDDLFVWGSVTKLLTGSGILRAVERGDLPSLSTPVHTLIDPLLSRLGLGSLKTLFGWMSKYITAKHLGSMKSGVPDYDTAKPWPRPPTDPFRAMVYKDPTREWDPADLLNVSWVATGKLEGIPGLRTSYSSTNFVLLGLLLAALQKAPTWDQMNQTMAAMDALPAARRNMYSHMRFGVHGPPSRYTSVHGYDRTSYNGRNASTRPGHTDVWQTTGVYGGWTASDITANVGDIARLGYDIFGKAGPRMLQPHSVATMIPTQPFYGFATFNLTRGWGPSAISPLNLAYGHLGATYGYQSIVAYFPAADISVSVASNIETDTQVQPSDTLCLAYNAILAALSNTTEPACEFRLSGYYGGTCDCGNTYACNRRSRTCEQTKDGYLSKTDCEASC